MLEVSPSFRRRAQLGAFVRRFLVWPAHVAEARRTLARLGQMTDRELGDIGLLRSDLTDATALPLGVDPGRRLAQARVARVRFAPRRRDRAALDASAILDDAIDDSRRLGIDEGGRETALVGGA
jgi:uncharacterized protein YjiS (DUF1127 family)